MKHISKSIFFDFFLLLDGADAPAFPFDPDIGVFFTAVSWYAGDAATGVAAVRGIVLSFPLGVRDGVLAPGALSGFAAAGKKCMERRG